MENHRLNEYRNMWVVVFYDLPTITKKQVRNMNQFRKNLLKNGFAMVQLSLYMRHCASWESAEAHMKRVMQFMPDEGSIILPPITDRQFRMMKVFHNGNKTTPPPPSVQLELF
jgi:CRISPR-associated protein Cas2